MREGLKPESFLVRIYRSDMEDPRKITGPVESLDRSMRRLPFRNADELADLLGRGTQVGLSGQ